jgi:hypothetical protein
LLIVPEGGAVSTDSTGWVQLFSLLVVGQGSSALQLANGVVIPKHRLSKDKFNIIKNLLP